MMKTQSGLTPNHAGSSARRGGAAVWLGWLVVLVVGAGGVMFFWLRQPPGPEPPGPAVVAEAEVALNLSVSTHAVLQNLNRPVTIRFYCLLSHRPGGESWQSFADRVSNLLTEFERAGAGKLRLTRIAAPTEGLRGAALAEGLEPLRLNRDQSDFLGVVISNETQRVVLARLDPHWEVALEFDLARAIARVAGGSSGEAQVNPAAMDATVMAELLQVLPTLDSLTLEQARHQVREVARAEYQTAVAALQAELQAAQARLAQEQSVAAREELVLLQWQQAEKLNEIPRRLQAQLELLARLKQ